MRKSELDGQHCDPNVQRQLLESADVKQRAMVSCSRGVKRNMTVHSACGRFVSRNWIYSHRISVRFTEFGNDVCVRFVQGDKPRRVVLGVKHGNPEPTSGVKVLPV